MPEYLRRRVAWARKHPFLCLGIATVMAVVNALDLDEDGMDDS